MSLSQFTTVRWHCAGEIRERHGSDFYWVVPSELFACKDGWIYINIVPSFWDAFAVFVELPELLIDERFATNDLRRDNRHILHKMIAPTMMQYTRAELMERAAESRVPLGIVQTFEDVLGDPHLATRDYWESISHDGATIKAPGIPWRINKSPRPTTTLRPIEAHQ